MSASPPPPAYPPGVTPTEGKATAPPPNYKAAPPAYPPGVAPTEGKATAPPPNYKAAPPAYPPGVAPTEGKAAAPPPNYKAAPPAYPPGVAPTEGKATAPPPAYPKGMEPAANGSREGSSIPKAVGANPQQQAALDAATKLAEETSKTRTAYAYTQGGFWNGPNADFSVLAILACFPLTGLVGLDHHYMRSPMTAALKTVLNIFTLGMWYFYDMGQVLSEADHVKKYGYSLPMFGPIGLGAGLFPQKSGEYPKGPSPARFMLYSVAATLGSAFGLDHLVAGDFSGFMAKIFALPIWILFLWWNPFYWVAMLCALVWAAVSLFRLWFNTEDIFYRGIARFFPFTLFMSDYRCMAGSLGPDRPCGDKAQGSGGTWNAILNFFKGIPVVGEAISTVEGTVEVAKAGAKVAVEAAKMTVAPVVGAASAAVSIGGQVIGAGQEAAKEVVGTAQKLANPATLAQMTMRGGGQPESKSSTGLIALTALMAGASFFIQYARKSDYIKLIPDMLRKTVEVRTDLPPF